MGQDFITRLIAQIIESFKTKNPKIYGIVALTLAAIVFFADKGTLLGLWVLDGQWAQAIQWAATVVGFLLGSRSVQFLPPEIQQKALSERGIKS
jgi:hypothetical protein